MKTSMLLVLSFVFFSLCSLAQPYGGTIFVNADIITAEDSSALESVSYMGQGIRTVYDRRVNNWTQIEAYLFKVIWNDGLVSEAVINPEFQTVDLALVEAEKYGWLIGQLPYCLRTDVDEIWINKGAQPFGGGNRSILIHTGQTVLYENDGILEETLVHEACHTSLDAAHASSPGWIEAQNMDGGFISDYAEEFPMREDIAESFLMWLAVRYRADVLPASDYQLITEAIPNRLTYFDQISCDLFPFYIESSTNTEESDQIGSKLTVSPNPTSNEISVVQNQESGFFFTLHDTYGRLVKTGFIDKHQSIHLMELKNGWYILSLINENSSFSQRILKF